MPSMRKARIMDLPLALRAVIIGVAAVFAFGAVLYLGSWYKTPDDWFSAMFALTLLVVAYGLVRRMAWARSAAVFLLWLIIVVAILGVINPFTASDWEGTGKSPPDVSTLLMMLVPLVSVIVGCLHILGKYKALFVTTGASDPSEVAGDKRN